jgi:hypothetical protein
LRRTLLGLLGILVTVNLAALSAHAATTKTYAGATDYYAYPSSKYIHVTHR